MAPYAPEQWGETAFREANVSSGLLTCRAWEASPSSPDIGERQRRSGLERTLAPPRFMGSLQFSLKRTGTMNPGVIVWSPGFSRPGDGKSTRVGSSGAQLPEGGTPYEMFMQRAVHAET